MKFALHSPLSFPFSIDQRWSDGPGSVGEVFGFRSLRVSPRCGYFVGRNLDPQLASACQEPDREGGQHSQVVLIQENWRRTVLLPGRRSSRGWPSLTVGLLTQPLARGQHIFRRCAAPTHLGGE
jgi:hypothetical protein